MPALEAILATQWAMMPDRVRMICEIAAREHAITPEALQAYRAEQHDKADRMRIRDGVAIIDMHGPMFKRGNLLTDISGASSYEIMRKDFQAALDDQEVTGIILNVDSPGGEANGADELAKAIYEARSQKPVVAYVSGLAASAGYWLATAAERVVVSDMAVLGSIGVVISMKDDTEAKEKRGVKDITFVSSQSPNKRPDINSEEGKSSVQTMINDLADVFVSAVAKHRGVDVETVIEKFGAGGVEVGAKAVALGMADSVGDFEGVLASLVKKGGMRRQNWTQGASFMSDNSKGALAQAEAAEKAESDANAQAAAAEAQAKVAADAAEKARKDAEARISGILDCEAAAGFQKTARFIAFKTNISAEDAKGILEAVSSEAEKVEASEGAPNTESSYEERKEEAGALGGGFGTPETPQKPAEAAQDTWSKVAAKFNGRAAR